MSRMKCQCAVSILVLCVVRKGLLWRSDSGVIYHIGLIGDVSKLASDLPLISKGTLRCGNGASEHRRLDARDTLDPRCTVVL